MRGGAIATKEHEAPQGALQRPAVFVAWRTQPRHRSTPLGSELGKVRRNDDNLAGSNRAPLLHFRMHEREESPMSSNTRMLLLSSNSGIEDVSPSFKTGQVVDVAEDSIKPSPELRRLLEQLDDDDGA